MSKKIASATGDIRKASELVEEHCDLKRINLKIKEYYKPLIYDFLVYLEFNFKVIVVSLLHSESISITDAFSNFKSFCKLHSMDSFQFYDFYDSIQKLLGWGVLKTSGKNHIIINFVFNEIEDAFLNDEEYKKLMKK